jgi:hypothetical protein
MYNGLFVNVEAGKAKKGSSKIGGPPHVVLVRPHPPHHCLEMLSERSGFHPSDHGVASFIFLIATTTMEGSTCSNPDGSSIWTLGLSPSKFTVLLISILALLPLVTILLGRRLVYTIGGWIGYYLRRKSEGRRSQILDLVEREEEAWEKEVKDSRRDSEEWDTLEGYGGGSVGNGEKGENEFDGIVGFFHPFW